MYLHNIELVKCHVLTLDEHLYIILFSFLERRFFNSFFHWNDTKNGKKNVRVRNQLWRTWAFFFYSSPSLSLSQFVWVSNGWLPQLLSISDAAFSKCITFSLPSHNIQHTHAYKRRANKIKHLCVSGCHCACFSSLCFSHIANVRTLFHGKPCGTCMWTGYFRHRTIHPYCKGCVKTQFTHVLMLNSLHRSAFIASNYSYRCMMNAICLFSLVLNDSIQSNEWTGKSARGFYKLIF